MRVKLVASLISIGVFLTACGAGDRQVEVSEPFVSVSKIGISELKTAITEEIIEESTEESTTEKVTEVETEEVTEESVEVEEPDGVVEDSNGVDKKPVEAEKPASKKSNDVSGSTAQKPQSTPQTTPQPETSSTPIPEAEDDYPSETPHLTPEEQALWDSLPNGTVEPKPPVGDGDYDFDDSNVIMH